MRGSRHAMANLRIVTRPLSDLNRLRQRGAIQLVLQELRRRFLGKGLTNKVWSKADLDQTTIVSFYRIYKHIYIISIELIASGRGQIIFLAIISQLFHSYMRLSVLDLP